MYLCNLKNVKNTHVRVILFKKLQAVAWNFIKSNTKSYFSFVIDNAKPTCLFFKLHELFQIAKSIIC